MNRSSSPRQPGKTALIVIGMHRSGTSATTGALQCLGVQLGKKLYAGHKGINDKGYFEHSDIGDTNEEALLALGSRWDDILLKEREWWRKDILQPYANKIRGFIKRDFGESQLWSIKDPTLCRLLPWWMQILAAEQIAPHFLFVMRSPHAVFRSLERRDGFSKERALLLWILHYQEAEQWSRGFPRAFLEFDRLLDSPVKEFERVERELELSFPVKPDKAAGCLEQFLSKDLRHHSGTNDYDHGNRLENLAHELENLLGAAVQNGDAALDMAALDDVRIRMEAIQNDFYAPLVENLREVMQGHGTSKLVLNRVLRSWSWPTGRPVRFLERLLGRDV